MNRILFILVLLVIALFLVVAVRAQSNSPPPSVTLGWTPRPGEAGNASGYWLWQGTNSGQYSRALFVPGWGTSQATLTNLNFGITYFWNITTTNSATGKESGYDGEVSTNWVAPPLAPTALRILSLTP
jgi:hypothetical protein